MRVIVVAKSFVSKPLLIIANSGRMLADSAQRAGYQSVVIDLFGDCDTEQLTLENWVVEDLSIPCIKKILDKLLKKYSVEQLLVGSGFEAQLETLQWLQAKFKLLGNDSDTVKQIVNPQQFFYTLQNLDINFPCTCFQPPESNTETWLVKPKASEGGSEIEFYQGQSSKTDVYWQRYHPGQVYSVLFVADGKEASIIGINRQWVVEHRKGQKFIFSGVIIEQEHALERHFEILNTWINQLSNVYGLLGLNGLDFIIDGDQCWVLEINSRPPASMVLYAREIDLINLHINACQGDISEAGASTLSQLKAYQIVYATTAINIHANISWPDWAMDRPRPDTNIDTEQPICSIIASGNNTDSVLQTLQSRTQTIYQLLNTKGLA